MTTNRPGAVTATLTLAAIIALGVWYAAKGPPRPAPASSPDSLFSAERAMAHVRAMAERPHPPGTADHARVRDYVVSQIKAFGVEPVMQTTTAVGTRFPEAGHVENILARLPGTKPGGPAVMLAAHYDGVGAGPAASDDGSGSSVLLETLRALKHGAPLEHDVIFLFTDAEESGLLGAAAFVAEHPWARDVEVMINFEARGTGGQAVMFQTGPGNLDQVRLLRRMPDVSATSLAVTVYQFLPNDTDLSEFFLLNKPGLNFAFADGVERYHTSEDDAAHIDPGSIQQEGGAALGLTRAFGHGPLPRPKTGNAVFFDLPLVGVVLYPESWALPLGLVTAALTLLAFVRVARRERRWLLGAVLGLVALAVSGAVGGGIAYLYTRHAPDGLAAPGVRGPAALGLALVALGIGLLCLALIRRWVSAAAAGLGPLLLWTGLAVASSWKLPGLSFAAMWPALAAAVVLCLDPESTSVVRRVGRWIPALLASLIMIPLIYGMGLTALGIAGPGGVAVGALVPLVAWLLIGDLDLAAGAHRWRAGFATLVVGAILAVGARQAGARAEFPERSVLAYAQDADGTDGWLVTAAGYAEPGSWGRAAVGPKAAPVTPGARDSAGALPRWLAGVAGGWFPVVAAPAPRVAVAPPVVTVRSDSIAGSERRLTLHVAAAPGTNSVGLRVTGAPVRAAWIDGRPVDRTRYRYTPADWGIAFWGPTDAGFDVTLAVASDAHPTLELMAQTAGLPALPGVVIPPRPSGVLPSQTGDMTVVRKKIAF